MIEIKWKMLSLGSHVVILKMLTDFRSAIGLGADNQLKELVSQDRSTLGCFLRLLR